MKTYLAAVAMAVALSACGPEPEQPMDAPTPTGKDFVVIQAMSPAIESSLRIGEQVTFKFDVDYELVSTKTASLTLVVQDASGTSLANQTYVVRQGTGAETLIATVMIPSTRVVSVFTPLTPQGQQTTTVVDSRVYEVGQ